MPDGFSNHFVGNVAVFDTPCPNVSPVGISSTEAQLYISLDAENPQRLLFTFKDGGRFIREKAVVINPEIDANSKAIKQLVAKLEKLYKTTFKPVSGALSQMAWDAGMFVTPDDEYHNAKLLAARAMANAVGAERRHIIETSLRKALGGIADLPDTLYEDITKATFNHFVRKAPVPILHVHLAP